GILQSMLSRYSDGKIKMYTMFRALKERKANPSLFEQGNYIPIAVSGGAENQVLAYARQYNDQWYLVAVPLGVTSCALGKELMVDAKVWGDAFLKLPENAPKEWIHVYTGERFADRKSTRLNSSHVKTSYAVFCLKENTRAWRPLRSSETH